jgi:NAD(P)H-nitrite reductase large subunit
VSTIDDLARVRQQIEACGKMRAVALGAGLRDLADAAIVKAHGLSHAEALLTARLMEEQMTVRRDGHAFPWAASVR